MVSVASVVAPAHAGSVFPLPGKILLAVALAVAVMVRLDGGGGQWWRRRWWCGGQLTLLLSVPMARWRAGWCRLNAFSATQWAVEEAKQLQAAANRPSS